LTFLWCRALPEIPEFGEEPGSPNKHGLRVGRLGSSSLETRLERPSVAPG